MKEACLGESGVLALRDAETPRALEGQVVVAVRHCGICGSDLHWFHGHSPGPRVCPGHEVSGEVVEVGAGCDEGLLGRPVAVEPLITCRTCWQCRSGNYQLCESLRIIGIMRPGGFAERVVVPEYAVYPVPAGIDLELASLTEPTAVAVHAVRLAAVASGDRVLILGGGTIGLLSILAAMAAGAREVALTARYPHQAELAGRLGAAWVFGTDEGGKAELAEYASQHPIDVVVETVGGEADTLGEAVERVRPGGTVMVLGLFDSSPPLPAVTLLLKEVRVIGSMTYGRAGRRSDFDSALDLLSDQGDVARSLVTHRFALGDIQAAFGTAGDKRQGSVKVTVMPGY
jgi:2-desacetyl-2-hydroxyethyl bacteriochlorophyllide A dehydrogenase